MATLTMEHTLQVSNTVPEMVSDAAAKQWDDNINRRLFDLVHSQATHEKLGGILAIGELMVQGYFVSYELTGSHSCVVHYLHVCANIM